MEEVLDIQSAMHIDIKLSTAIYYISDDQYHDTAIRYLSMGNEFNWGVALSVDHVTSWLDAFVGVSYGLTGSFFLSDV